MHGSFKRCRNVGLCRGHPAVIQYLFKINVGFLSHS
ncbi:hypothetical protein ACV2HS_17370 [Salmonella enterica subsp. enterica serovar Ouakam]